MNHVRIEAVAGSALGRSSSHLPTIRGILKGRAIGPASGFILGSVVMKALAALCGG